MSRDGVTRAKISTVARNELNHYYSIVWMVQGKSDTWPLWCPAYRAYYFYRLSIGRFLMALLVYVRLIGLTAGTLAQLFWMVVILAYRRQRNFERVFFFLC